VTYLPVIVLACGLLPAIARADNAADRAAIQDLGSVLAWRLGPEAVEVWCRNADPDGVAVRQAALQGWLEKNAARIKAVDDRVAEVVPLIHRSSDAQGAIAAIRNQVKDLVIETNFGAKSPREVAAICKAEADPSAARWTSTGMPQVQMSLSALYDWQVTRREK
jgi:hypothetical protein